MAQLPIHFFTIVLNGQPFIGYHLERMQALSCPWHWHIVEGLADLTHDTAWSLDLGAVAPADVVRQERSVDGTAEYLDRIAAEEPERITLYRAPNGRNWDGKLEMISAPLANLRQECLLWQIDADELWTSEQFAHLREMFLADPERHAAMFYCHFFVGPQLAINRNRRYAEMEWPRVWRFVPGMIWLKHEPPVLAVPIPNQPGQFRDVSLIKPFWPCETAAEGLIFQHYAYVTAAQLAFKETYYGYQGITGQWQALNARQDFPVALKEYFNWPWVDAAAMVEPLSAIGIKPLARLKEGKWEFAAAAEVTVARPKRGVLYVKWGAQVEGEFRRSLDSLAVVHPELPVHVHQLPDNASLLDKSRMFDFTPFEETLFLDTDTVVLGRLDFGFSMGRQHGLACGICENPWARRYGSLAGDLIEYNTGVLFFTAAAKPVFDFWAAHVLWIDSSIRFFVGQELRTMRLNDQAAFSLAVANWGKPPFILPFNWNFRPQWHHSWWGPIKIWHDHHPVLPEVVNWSKAQAQPGAIVQFASLRTKSPQ